MSFLVQPLQVDGMRTTQHLVHFNLRPRSGSSKSSIRPGGAGLTRLVTKSGQRGMRRGEATLID